MSEKTVEVRGLGQRGAPKHLVCTLNTGATLAMQSARGSSERILPNEAESPELLAWESRGWVRVERPIETVLVEKKKNKAAE